MASRRAHPVATILLSVVSFLLVDNLVFRSGLYANVQNPNTYSGALQALIRFNSGAAADPDRNVLLVGNSRMQYGFSVKAFEEDFPQSPLKLILAAVPSSNEEQWYYMLQRLDPHHDRYAAVVIPLAGYKVAPWQNDNANHYETAQIVGPIVPPRLWAEFLDGFDVPDTRLRALTIALFTSHAYEFDLQDLLFHPVQRLNDVAARNRAGINFLYGLPITSENMCSLRLDPATGRPQSYPSRFKMYQIMAMNQEFISPPPGLARSLTNRNALYEARWIGKIVEAYHGSRTRLIFVDMPHEPLPLPARAPIVGAPDVRQFIPRWTNITVLPAGAFADLQQPRYFADMDHLNAEANVLFTRRLGQAIIEAVGPSAGKAYVGSAQPAHLPS